MAEDPAGQGGEPETPTGIPDERITELEEELDKANQLITRLKGTQSSNDRAFSNLRAEKQTLEEQLQSITEANETAIVDLGALQTQNDVLSQRVTELSTVEAEVVAAKAQAERMQIAAIMAGETPAIALLVKSGALPQAETTEAFQASLAEIAEGLQGVVSSAARQQLAGSRPGNVQKIPPSANSLEEEAMRLLEEGKYDDGMKLYTQALELRTKQS